MTKQTEALAEQPAQQQEPVANELKLHIIRKWPEGFQDRLQHVWLDVVSFIPDVKLYDLQRVLAEFGFTMKVYEGNPPASKPWVGPSRLDGMRKAIYDLDCALWRARVAAERNGEQHTQLGHSIDALKRLKTAFGIATPQPDTNGTRSWFTVDELNAWADKYNKAHGIKGDA